MGSFGSLRGHYSLQTALKVKSDLIFQISDLNYTCCLIYLTSNYLNFKNQTQEEENNDDPLTCVLRRR